MNKRQYQEYQESVANFLKKNNVRAGCHSPKDVESEAFFSWRPCECCKQLLGGDRETYNFAQENGETFEAEICLDCVYYLAYDRLDDQTMLDMEDLEQKEQQESAIAISEEQLQLQSEYDMQLEVLRHKMIDRGLQQI